MIYGSYKIFKNIVRSKLFLVQEMEAQDIQIFKRFVKSDSLTHASRAFDKWALFWI